MPWTMDIQGPNGGANLATDVRYKSARIAWTADGPGAIEVDVLGVDMSDLWTPGTHRVIAKLDGVPMFAGYLENLTRSFEPEDGAMAYTVAGRGLASVLDVRFIHKPTVFTAIDTPSGDIAWQLIDALQSQVNGDMGFTQGATVGTTVSRTRSYCAGSNVGDEIRELAATGRGFDWEISPTGQLLVWNGSRGSDLSASRTVTPTEANGWEVEADTTELITAANAVGDAAKPFGPQIERTVTGLSDTYGRREAFFDVDTTEDSELEDAATAQLAIQGGARVRITADWWEGVGPWAFGEVWLQDIVSADLDSWFGGDQDVRCTDIEVTIDPNPPEAWHVTQAFEALVTDITGGASDA